MSRPRILLSSVFGPFGVDDAYGRRENIMELFHNQVTREQGVFSLRFNHASFGLHLMAANVDADVTVLDFPSQRRFVKELKKGWDYVGIGFITPNMVKARRMAELVRLHAPEAQVILGGHGTRIPGITELIDCDHVCRGEGVTWLRRLLGQDPHAPYRHPILESSFNKRVMGVPLTGDAATLLPGVGCPNQCRFCATSHFFDKVYTPYFDTGAELFEICCRAEDERGITEVFVMDENFLKRPERARELLRLMEEAGRVWRFGLFSSAETLMELGPDFLLRLGVYFLWIGVESKVEVFEKNAGADLPSLIAQLKERGVSVLASGILFLEHHDQQTIWEDIEYVSSLGADFVQFMQLGPLPTTQLYRDYEAKGLLREDNPYEEWHGQHQIWFKHPHFTGPETEDFLRRAFQFEYDKNGPSILRMFHSQALGVAHLRRVASTDPHLNRRLAREEANLHHVRPLLPVIRRHAHNERARALAEEVMELTTRLLGPPTAAERAFTLAARGLARAEAFKVRTDRNRYQPGTQLTRYDDQIRAAIRVSEPCCQSLAAK